MIGSRNKMAISHLSARFHRFIPVNIGISQLSVFNKLRSLFRSRGADTVTPVIDAANRYASDRCHNLNASAVDVVIEFHNMQILLLVDFAVNIFSSCSRTSNFS